MNYIVKITKRTVLRPDPTYCLFFATYPYAPIGHTASCPTVAIHFNAGSEDSLSIQHETALHVPYFGGHQTELKSVE
jgi:hypothetical protein